MLVPSGAWRPTTSPRTTPAARMNWDASSGPVASGTANAQAPMASAAKANIRHHVPRSLGGPSRSRALSTTGHHGRCRRAAHRPGAGAAGPSAAQSIGDEVDAAGERLEVLGVDRREQGDAQLVAPELAVALGV